MIAAAVGAPVVFALVSTISPGGATTLATASGARFGLRRSAPLIAGIAVGLAALAGAASLGLGGLLLAVPSAQLATRIAGTGYLVWLAWRIARSGAPQQAAVTSPTSFLGGFALLWLNPKGWAMILSAAAAFARLTTGPRQLAALLTASFGCAAAVSLTLWASAGVLFARLLRTPVQWRVLNSVLAALLIAAIVPMWF